MSQPYVTGPVHIYVATASGGGDSNATPPVADRKIACYLGTCEVAPQMIINPKFEPLMNDLTGSQLPYDYLFQGEDGMIIGDLTLWNENVLSDCQNRAQHASGRGTNSDADIGALMLTGGLAYDLWLVYSNGGNTLYTDAGMPTGRHFFRVFLEGPDEHTIGTRANKRHIVFHCLRLRTGGALKLFDEATAGDWDTDTNIYAGADDAAKGTGTAFPAVATSGLAHWGVPIVPPTAVDGVTYA